MISYVPDSRFADSFLCDSTVNYHEKIFISPTYDHETSLLYCVNRGGITKEVPQLFHVKRKANFKCCHIFCITSGRGALHVDGQSYVLKEGALVVLSNLSAHEYYSSSHAPLGMTWLEFYGSDSTPLISKIIQQRGNVFESAAYGTVVEKIENLVTMALDNGTIQFSRHIYDILMDLYEDAQDNAQKNLGHQLVGKFLTVNQYIDDHLAEKLSLDDLAQLTGYSNSHFAKLFKEVYGVAAYEFILQKRITAAKYLLSCSTMAVGEIAATVGFCDASHFLKRFRQYEGMAPKEYRQMSLFTENQ